MATPQSRLSDSGSIVRPRWAREPRRPPKDMICRELVTSSRQHFPRHLRAIILTGSLARDEATFVHEAGVTRMLGDVEFLLLFKDGVPLPRPVKTRALCYQIQYRLQRAGVRCPVGLSAVHARYLRRLKPHIYGYELRECGRVLWGDKDVLELIPRFTAADLPREDAWRMLSNRIVEALEASGPETPESRSRYRAAKLYLDMATSVLVFADAYEPTYRGRLARLEELAKNGDALHLPFSLAELVPQVAESTDLKLNGLLVPPADDGQTIGALRHALMLWRWELERLTRSKGGDVSTQKLWKRWASQQPWRQRLRGWLYVMRQHGWLRSGRHVPRWLYLALSASPRYWVYAVAVEHASRILGDGTQGPLPRFSDSELARRLPLRASGGSSHDALLEAISKNYHQFLVNTRS